MSRISFDERCQQYFSEGMHELMAGKTCFVAANFMPKATNDQPKAATEAEKRRKQRLNIRERHLKRPRTADAQRNTVMSISSRLCLHRSNPKD